MKGLNQLGKIATKVIEVFHWVGATLMLAAVICAHAAPGLVGCFVGFDAKECCGAALKVYGFEIVARVTDGEVEAATLSVFGIGAVMILALMAMVFRNLHLIFKKSENATPFQRDNVRLVREIGIFTIAIPILGFVMSVIARLVGGVQESEISVDMGGIVMGIVLLCLSRFFAYGVSLENDVDGLL